MVKNTYINRFEQLDKSISVEEISKKPLKLDIRDKKIIFELTKNSRMPISKIAKVVGLSRENTNYKIDRLIKLGVIQGFTPQINLSKLGIHWHFLLLDLKNFHPQFEEKLQHYITHNSYIVRATRYIGEYGLVIEMCTKTLVKFNFIVKEIRDLCGDHLRDYSLLTALKDDKLVTASLGTIGIKTEDLIANRKFIENKRIDEEQFSENHLDDKDRAILKLLAVNSRMPSTDIGTKIGLSNDGVISRIKKMQNNGIITNFTGTFTLQGLGTQKRRFLRRNV